MFCCIYVYLFIGTVLRRLRVSRYHTNILPTHPFTSHLSPTILYTYIITYTYPHITIYIYHIQQKWVTYVTLSPLCIYYVSLRLLYTNYYPYTKQKYNQGKTNDWQCYHYVRYIMSFVRRTIIVVMCWVIIIHRCYFLLYCCLYQV